MWAFGFHSTLATVSSQLVNQAAPIIIGHLRPPEFVGFYNVPLRLLSYTGTELAARVGLVTVSKSAELAAHQETRGIVQMGIYTNRYCVTMFAPLALMVTIWGAELLKLWIHPAAVGQTYAAQSAPLFLPFVLGMAVAVMGQYNSSTILFGMGRHKWYSRGLVVEAALTVPLMIMAVKTYGIVGAAWVGAILMILDRGLWASFVLCRVVDYSWLAYLKAIYWRPFLCAVPVAALMIWLKATILAPARWQEFIAAGLITGISYSVLAWFYSVFPEHRAMAVNWIRHRLRPA
jgi:O-antigen/teichoic acid export membrane protein